MKTREVRAKAECRHYWKNTWTGKGKVILLSPISPCHTQNLYQDLELSFANLAQLTQALPPGILFAVGLGSHSRLTCNNKRVKTTDSFKPHDLSFILPMAFGHRGGLTWVLAVLWKLRWSKFTIIYKITTFKRANEERSSLCKRILNLWVWLWRCILFPNTV